MDDFPNSWCNAVMRLENLLAALALSIAGSGGLLAEPAAAEGAKFAASGELVIQWPAGAGSGALDAEGRAAFCSKMALALEGQQLGHQALERMRALHPNWAEIPVNIQAERVRNTAIIRVTAQGGEPKYVRTYLNALLDKFMAFYISTSLTTTGDPFSKTIAEVLAREKAVKKKTEERQQFMKAHPQDFNADDNKAPYDALTMELERMDRDYRESKKDLRNLAEAMQATIPDIDVMERP